MGSDEQSQGTKALLMAKEALVKIDEHERICAERYLGIQSSSQMVTDAIKGLYNRFWLVALSIIGLLLGIVGYLYTENQKNIEGQLEDARYYIQKHKESP